MNNLRFADDIILISSDVNELTERLEQLYNAERKMNLIKSKLIKPTDIIIEHQIVENVNEFFYLGHNLKLGKENQTLRTAVNLKRKVYE